MGCCSSQDLQDVSQPGDDVVCFDYCAATGAIIPVRRSAAFDGVVPGKGTREAAYSNEDQFAQSVLHPDARNASYLTEKQGQFIDEGVTVADKLERMEQVEEVKRQEIEAAFTLTSKMLELARKRVKPMYRFRRGVRHTDPLESEPTVVVRALDLAEGQLPEACYSPREEETAACPELNPTAQRLQVLDVSGLSIPPGHKTKCAAKGNAWDFLSEEGAGQHLSSGQAFFGFVCSTYAKLNEDDLRQLETIVNITGFEDEMRDNNCPVLDVRNAEVMSAFTMIMVKAMYLLPGFDPANMNRDVMASLEYQKACQPGNPKFWDDCTDEYTFRSTKTLVRFVYSIVIQLRVHEITDPDELRRLSVIDGLLPEKAILLERTKRDKMKKDSTLKCKSILLYYRVTGGTLVANVTTIVNTSIPNVVARVVNNFGSSGAQEVADTATQTRAYLLEKFGDSRLQS